MKQVALRIVPFLMVCYFVSFVDRVNLGFAALQMVKDLHLSPTVFGFGGGIFFVSYFLCEVPSNLFLEKFGARRWIARIMRLAPRPPNSRGQEMPAQPPSYSVFCHDLRNAKCCSIDSSR